MDIINIMSSKKIITGIAVAVIIVMLIIFSGGSSKSIVTTVTVTKGSITHKAEAVGYIKTSHSSTVKSQVDGIIEALYHDEGEYVTKNTPLAKIKPMPSPEVYAAAHQELANAISEEKEAATILERQKYLLASKVISANNFNYTAARNKYTVAKNNTILAKQKLALLENGEAIVSGKQIENVVVSPINGNILRRGVDIGDPVISISSAQSATELFIVADINDLMFQGTVDEHDAAQLNTGMNADIKVGSLPDKNVTGKISKVALQSEKKDKNNLGNQDSPFNVGFKIEINNLQFPKDLILRSGYSATASITIKKVDNVLLLPLRVIQYKDTKPYVLLQQKNKKTKQQPVELGVSDNINVEIKNGLKLGDKIVDQPDSTINSTEE